MHPSAPTHYSNLFVAGARRLVITSVLPVHIWRHNAREAPVNIGQVGSELGDLHLGDGGAELSGHAS